MNTPNLNLTQMLTAAAAGGAGAWHLIRPIAQPSIDKAISGIPAWLAGRARDRFAAAVASGKVPPSAVRLLKKLGSAAVEWAREESANSLTTSAEQAGKIVAALEHFPGLDRIVALDPDDLAHDIAVGLDALKAEVRAPAPAAPAPAAPVTPK